MGYDLTDVWRAVQALRPGNFVKSAPAHNPDPVRRRLARHIHDEVGWSLPLHQVRRLDDRRHRPDLVQGGHIMTDTRIHPTTGRALSRGVRPQIVAFGSMSRVVDVPGWYPDDDGDSIHSGRRPAREGRGVPGAARRLRQACAPRPQGASASPRSRPGSSSAAARGPSRSTRAASWPRARLRSA